MVNESRPIRILLVEDNELNRDMLSRRLKRRGFEVLTALDGENAVQITTDLKPDIVLMDMGLPGMNGWDATRVLKGDVETKDIPVIALTAHAMSADRDQALAAGCDAFETKPVELDRLLETIHRLVSTARLMRQ
jgi:CheY-like chemotaxis protein